MSKFEVGDAVIVKRKIGNLGVKDVVAIVRIVDGDTIGVEALNKTIKGHSIQGKTKIYKDNGWFICDPTEKEVEIISGDNLEHKGFRVGDRVISVRGVGRNEVIGAKGTVINPFCSISVLFDRECKVNGHKCKCSGNWYSCDRDDGWNCQTDDLRKLDDPTEIPEAPQEPQEYTEFVGFIKQVPEQYIYVARDMDGKLFAYIDEPKIDVGGIQYWEARFKRLNDDLFPKLTFKDGALKIREVKGSE